MRNGKIEAAKPIDVSVVLTFESAREDCPRMPAPIPNIFTGASRVGTADGRQLCNDFGCDAFAKSMFSHQRGCNAFIGNVLWKDLRRLMKERVIIEEVVKVEEKKEDLEVVFFE